MVDLKRPHNGVYMKNVRIVFFILAAGVVFFINDAFAKDSGESRFGYYTDKAILSTRVILTDETINNRVREIGQKLAKSSGRSDLNYTFRILNDPTINAYSAAGGFIYINTGLLDILDSEDELAAMIAHEMAHTNLRHQIKYINSMNEAEIESLAMDTVLGVGIGAVTGFAAQTALAAVMPPASMFMTSSSGNGRHTQSDPSPFYTSFVNKAQGEITGRATGMGVGFGGALGNELVVAAVTGYGKKQELEADSAAIRYLKNAGYDPRALIRGFEKLMSVRNSLGISERNYVSNLMNAEPGLDDRVKNAENALKAGGIS